MTLILSYQPEKITSPATVSSVTVVGSTTGDFAGAGQDGVWYVTDMYWHMDGWSCNK